MLRAINQLTLSTAAAGAGLLRDAEGSANVTGGVVAGVVLVVVVATHPTP